MVRVVLLNGHLPANQLSARLTSGRATLQRSPSTLQGWRWITCSARPEEPPSRSKAPEPVAAGQRQRRPLRRRCGRWSRCRRHGLRCWRRPLGGIRRIVRSRRRRMGFLRVRSGRSGVLRHGRLAEARAAGRKPGKQPGTPGTYLRRRDPDVTVVHGPVCCGGCGTGMEAAVVVGTEVRQVIDLIAARVHVTEHVVERCRCACGSETAGVFPSTTITPRRFTRCCNRLASAFSSRMVSDYESFRCNGALASRSTVFVIASQSAPVNFPDPELVMRDRRQCRQQPFVQLRSTHLQLEEQGRELRFDSDVRSNVQAITPPACQPVLCPSGGGGPRL